MLIGQAAPVLTVDLEFGRNGAALNGDLGEPTWRARARLRLVER
jgi:hypothetical protein